jgi:hypothetical protein
MTRATRTKIVVNMDPALQLEGIVVYMVPSFDETNGRYALA